jgi:hypothetical protein
MVSIIFGFGGTDNARIMIYEPEIILILELLIYENYLHMYELINN